MQTLNLIVRIHNQVLPSLIVYFLLLNSFGWFLVSHSVSATPQLRQLSMNFRVYIARETSIFSYFLSLSRATCRLLLLKQLLLIWTKSYRNSHFLRLQWKRWCMVQENKEFYLPKTSRLVKILDKDRSLSYRILAFQR